MAQARGDAGLSADVRTHTDVVREAVEAFRRRDADAIMALSDPGYEFRSSFLSGAVYRGDDGIRRYLNDIDDAFDEWDPRDEEVIEAEDGRVVLLYRIVGKGRGSGIPVDVPLAIVWTFRDGKILVAEVFLDQQEALKAVGAS